MSQHTITVTLHSHEYATLVRRFDNNRVTLQFDDGRIEYVEGVPDEDCELYLVADMTVGRKRFKKIYGLG